MNRSRCSSRVAGRCVSRGTQSPTTKTASSTGGRSACRGAQWAACRLASSGRVIRRLAGLSRGRETPPVGRRRAAGRHSGPQWSARAVGGRELSEGAGWVRRGSLTGRRGLADRRLVGLPAGRSVALPARLWRGRPDEHLTRRAARRHVDDLRRRRDPGGRGAVMTRFDVWRVNGTRRRPLGSGEHGRAHTDRQGEARRRQDGRGTGDDPDADVGTGLTTPPGHPLGGERRPGAIVRCPGGTRTATVDQTGERNLWRVDGPSNRPCTGQRFRDGRAIDSTAPTAGVARAAARTC